MEIGVRKEYVITTKGTPLHSHCQVWEGGVRRGLARGGGEVDRKKNARVVVAASTTVGLGAVPTRSQVVCAGFPNSTFPLFPLFEEE